MEAFISYCTGRTSGNKEECLCITRADAENKPSYEKVQSPSSIKRFIDCSNMACNEHTEDCTKWKKATSGLKKYHFCSDDCYHDWLEDPSQIGSWSPSSTDSETPSTSPSELEI
jgi:YHS domain-containing protein|tara:strand:- start:663 stop:1004 length:342 start_codon:yes stop_codon:yes gene_type:complete